VHGIEWIPQFVDTSQKIAASLKFSKITFSCDDMFQSEQLETTLQKASCIYLYGTCLNADALTYLTALFKKLRPGTKIVTVSEPLQEEEETSHFKCIKSFQGIFPWGMTELYLHEVQ
jgi:purine-nucleoside phosphorylase